MKTNNCSANKGDGHSLLIDLKECMSAEGLTKHFVDGCDLVMLHYDNNTKYYRISFGFEDKNPYFSASGVPAFLQTDYRYLISKNKYKYPKYDLKGVIDFFGVTHYAITINRQTIYRYKVKEDGEISYVTPI